MIECKVVALNRVIPTIKSKYGEGFVSDNNSNYLSEYFQKLKQDIFVLIEFPYIDKLYRNSYYSYFSSKSKHYKRNTIRLSFFSSKIKLAHFRRKGKFKFLQSSFLGFLVVRPIEKSIGRNLISPDALLESNFYIRTTEISTTVNGVRLDIEGFPHCSQNSESMTCAETTLWSLMEYFGTKYPEYAPTLPSKIRILLDINNTPQRLLPSNGLTVTDISFLIRKFGFGSRTYFKDAYETEAEYFSVLNCYIESGIPLLLEVANEKISHAVLCIGRKYISKKELKRIYPVYLDDIPIYDYDMAKRNIVLIDDNYPPYQISSLDNPTEYYKNHPEWSNCEIKHFVVPLHEKIYLVAEKAKSCFDNLVKSGLMSLPENKKNYVRFFLTSGRNLKFNLNSDKDFDLTFKNHIINLEFPQFIWVREVSNENLANDMKANGIIILDATETNSDSFKPVIIAAYNNKLLQFNIEGAWQPRIIDLPLRPFKMFNNNLKTF